MRRSGPRLTKIGRPSSGDYGDNFSQMRSADWVLDGVWVGIGGNKKSKSTETAEAEGWKGEFDVCWRSNPLSLDRAIDCLARKGSVFSSL